MQTGVRRCARDSFSGIRLGRIDHEIPIESPGSGCYCLGNTCVISWDAGDQGGTCDAIAVQFGYPPLGQGGVVGGRDLPIQ